MVSLLDLPEDLLRVLYMEWLTFPDMSRLDAALCEARRRAEYLNIISSDATIFNTYHTFFRWDKVQNQIILLKWLVKRHVKASHLRLDVYDSSIMGIVDLTKLKGLVQHLILCGDRGKMITKIFNILITSVSTSLTSITLTRCKTIVNALQSCEHLTSLKLVSNPNVKDESMEIILPHTPLLTELTIEKSNLIRGSFLTTLAQNCRHLKILRLSRVTLTGTKVTLTGTNEVRITCDALDFPALECLQLENFQNRSSHSMVPDVLVALVSAAPNLETLSLWGSTCVTDGLFLQVLAKMPPLKELELFLTSVTDVTLLALAQSCASLTRLDCSHNDHITDSAAMQLVSLVPALTYLNLSNCPLVLPIRRRLGT